MMVQYYPDTDMLYIKLAEGSSTDSEEVAPGIVLDLDAQTGWLASRLKTQASSWTFHNSESRASPYYPPDS